jgi:general secretion pathway protein A
MYETFFGLKSIPFTVMPDPRFAYRSLGHRMAEGRMRFAADYKAGLAVLTGPVGSGKTTVANMLMGDWGGDPTKSVAYLPTADDRGRAAFLKRIMDGFGIESTARNYGANRTVLEQFLLDEHKAGRHAVLVIDEAQKIHPENFDTLVDLTNFQTATEKFITIILIAQDNFANKLRTKDAFTSRIAFTGHLDPLSFEDFQGMIAHRLGVAGATIKEKPAKGRQDALPNLTAYLTDEALVEVYHITKGVPRDVCMFLSTLFLDAFVIDTKPIVKDQVCNTLKEMSRLKKWPVATDAPTSLLEGTSNPQETPSKPRRAPKATTTPTKETSIRETKENSV